MERLLGGRYQVVHPVWRDRLGETYVARDRVSGCPVAVRTLPAHLARGTVVRRCREERARLTAIRHPVLAAVLDVTEDRGGSGGGAGAVLGIVTEAVEGHTLRHRLRTGPALPAAEVARIGAAVAAGLHALHAAGLVHQGVRPDTVVLDRDGRVRLTDIALAHLVDPHPAAREHLRAEPAAPEVLAGADPTPASDLFALGVLLDRLTRRRAPAPLRRLTRQLRARDPGARPTAHQVRLRLSPPDGRQDDDSPTDRARGPWTRLAGAR